jgi:hypothetical protein
LICLSSTIPAGREIPSVGSKIEDSTLESERDVVILRTYAQGIPSFEFKGAWAGKTRS